MVNVFGDPCSKVNPNSFCEPATVRKQNCICPDIYIPSLKALEGNFTEKFGDTVQGKGRGWGWGVEEKRKEEKERFLLPQTFQLESPFHFRPLAALNRALPKVIVE